MGGIQLHHCRSITCMHLKSHVHLLQQRRLGSAKEKHRPKLKNWQKDRFAFDRKQDFLALQQLPSGVFNVANANDLEMLDKGQRTVVVKVHCTNLTYSAFISRFEGPALPCVIAGVPAAEGWGAVQKWADFRYFRCVNDRYFKVGEDDDGYSVKVRMRYFLEYLKNNSDDSPLYVFDSHFGEDGVSKVLLSDYSVPSYFPEDYFSLVGERRRPPYRWFLLGPARSGSCVHIDPLGTSAWNTVLRGRKRWVLFPPETPKSIAKGLDVIKKGEDDEAVNYFVDILPRIKQKWGEIYNIIEFTQDTGDTVYVPGGWWHAVLNLNDTIAVTQNYCSSSNFDRVWVRTRGGRKKMAAKLLKKLRDENPALAERAEELNRRDNFVMYGQEPSLLSENKKRRKLDSHASEKKPHKKKKSEGS